MNGWSWFAFHTNPERSISREYAGLEDEECEDGIVRNNSELWSKDDEIDEWREGERGGESCGRITEGKGEIPG
jgi:hypothetical protein